MLISVLGLLCESAGNLKVLKILVFEFNEICTHALVFVARAENK